jgi:hypothetical protein
MGQDVDAAREALGTVPPARPAGAGKPADATAGGSGPHAPGAPTPTRGEAPDSGGYDTRPPRPLPDNRKGGYGAG